MQRNDKQPWSTDLWQDTKTHSLHLLQASLLFVYKLLLVGTLVGSDIGIKELLHFAMMPESPEFRIFSFILDVFLLGAAAVAAASGAIVVVVIVSKSTLEYIRRVLK